MNWLLINQVTYVIVLIIVCARIIYETRSTTKTLAYLLLAIFVPFAGMLFYFTFGVNYRVRRMYSKKLVENDYMAARLREDILRYSSETFQQGDQSLRHNKELAFLLLSDASPLTSGNSVKLLVNGEEKFPEVIQAIREARHHIHLEYYIIEDGEITEELTGLLEQKAREGVTVRVIFDDFGSRSVARSLTRRLRASGAQIFPFLKVHFLLLANRINYRNHRKIIVVDGKTAFVGGINVSDRYVNRPGENKLFWRDTHLRVDGPGVQYLQYLFLCDWNFCAEEKIQPSWELFPRLDSLYRPENRIVQIAASGPDSEVPTILYSIIQAINLATEEILISTPYLIPGETLLDALVIAARSGVAVKLLLPSQSDSRLVDAAARSYYDDLLSAGVDLYLYRKGFMHAKTMVTDGKVAIVGTANMDVRSFELNFEVNAVVYDREVAGRLREIFYKDLEDAVRIEPERWQRRKLYRKMLEKCARLVSPLL